MSRSLRVLAIATIAAVSCAGPALAQDAKSGAIAPAKEASDVPRMEFVFEEFVTLSAAMHPGETPFGDRNIVPITGGTFSGPRIHGKVLPGGWDWQLATKTGCFSLHADYMIQTDDGAIINVVNNGATCEKPGSNARLFTTPTFEAPLGPHAWLNGGAFIGTLETTTVDGKPAVHIRFYRAE